MILSLVLTLATAQPGQLTAPPVPPVDGFRLIEDRDGLVTRILALDRQLRAPRATWAVPAAGVGLGLGALTFSVATIGLMGRPSTAAGVFLGLGALVGVVATIVGMVAGFFAYADALKRGQLDERRQRLIDELERRAQPPTSAAPPRSA